ncbi:MAG: nitrile hydratase accessory protein [Proteobacteria bacterium]|nr:nitrile hydratase accessory protein [Pseudomonadota bacterium]
MSCSDPERPFEEPWQAQAFAMVVRLHERGHFTWPEWAEMLGAELKAQPERAYYESWLVALERMTAAKALLSDAERLDRVAAWDRAARATPHGQPILLENAAPVFDFQPV